jgi:hypothetical protein
VIGSPLIRDRMLHDARRATVLALVLELALPSLGRAQEPSPAAGAGVGGSWEGWAKLANDWPGEPCRYEGSAASTSVHLELSAAGGQLRGSAAIDLPAEPGSSCPALRKRYTIDEVTVAETTVAFTDSGGNEWNLSLRRGGAVLQGLLAWRSGGPDQPLAEGFTRANGERPLAHLSGEVRLHRAGDTGTAGAEGGAPGEVTTSATPAAKPKGSGGLSTLGIVLGANVVGLGLLYGVNRIGKGTSEQGVITCSPRVCVVGAPGAPCFCEGNVVSGATCGTTVSGAPIGAPCDGQATPCESALSCNSGICEDRFGRCPY